MVSGVGAEFVVAAADVLDERVTADHDCCSPIAFAATHRAQAGLEPAVVVLDAVIGVLLGVVARVGDQFLDHRDQRRGFVGDDLHGPKMSPERGFEEAPSGRGVASRRDEDVDDLAVLVDRPIHVTPDTSDLDIGLVDEPAVPDHMATRSRSFDQTRRETLHPPKDADMVDLDTALREEFLGIAVGQPVAQIPAHRHQDHLAREAEASERRQLRHGRRKMATTFHLATLAATMRSVNATVH